MIHDEDVSALLRAATDDIDVAIAPADRLAEAGDRRLRRRRVVAVAGGAAVVALVIAGISLTTGLRPDPAAPTSTPRTTAVQPVGCVMNVPSQVLPLWARSGFSEPRPRIAYVSGQRGYIIAILFGQPLNAPPAADHNNKILWVPSPEVEGDTAAATGSPDLLITARLANGSATVTRTVSGGPGPSIIDLPEPGCWHLTLQWSGHTDDLALWYAAR